jgi:hypothetical protein
MNVWLSCMLTFLTVASCGYGEGTLVVTTSPVCGIVTVDGVSRGDAPLTVMIPAGSHEIEVRYDSALFLTPDPVTIEINRGETTSVERRFQPRFLPAVEPVAFPMITAIMYFGITKRPLSDGTVFDYINGGALPYLDHGLRELAHAAYTNKDSAELVIDVYDMSSAVQAAAAFEDKRIRPDAGEPCDVGAPCRSYAYPPDFFLLSQIDRYLVYIGTTDDRQASTVRDIACSVIDAIGAGIRHD